MVRQSLSARQHVRPSAVEILAPQADSRFRANLRFPPVHGAFHLHDVRHPTDADRSLERGRIAYVERHWSRVLDDYRDYDCRRRYAEFHLCASHMVFVLSYGNHFVVGGTQEAAASQALYRRARCSHLPDEVQELRPRLSHATHALRQPRSGDWLSASRLPEVRQMRLGLSDKDYGIEKVMIRNHNISQKIPPYRLDMEDFSYIYSQILKQIQIRL